MRSKLDKELLEINNLTITPKNNLDLKLVGAEEPEEVFFLECISFALG